MNKWVIRALVFLGLLQSFAFILNFEKLKGLATTTVASPLALVFSNFRGLDTYALDLTLKLKEKDNRVTETKITPALYAKLNGPYNLRNVYGAAISYGAKFEKENEISILKAVLQYGLCSPGQLLKDFGLPQDVKEGMILIDAKGTEQEWRINFTCKS